MPASREHADRLILQARKHLTSAGEISEDDPEVEYPPTDAPQIGSDDVREDATKAAAIVDLCERILDQMSPF